MRKLLRYLMLTAVFLAASIMWFYVFRFVRDMSKSARETVVEEALVPEVEQAHETWWHPREDGLVTLMLPYPEGKDGNNRRISLALAVRAVCLQAGLKYNAEASRIYAEPEYEYNISSWDKILSILDEAKLEEALRQYYASDYKNYLFPEFEDIAWEEAMRRLLSPFNLIYVVEDDAVVLKRPESCCQGKETPVKLRPPYTLLKRFKDEPPERTTIKRAVQLICEQAGMELYWPDTYRNIGPLAESYTYPDLEGITWENAMRDILSPRNLDYTIKDDRVTLVSTKYGHIEPDSNALVVLQPPYSEWVRDTNDKRHGLTLKEAVWAVSLQAGMKNVRYERGHGTKDLLTRVVYPDFDGIAWEEAMEELLAPRYLSYCIDDDGVLLKRADNKGLGKDSLVTLTPPYSAWKSGKDHSTGAISLQQAVKAICEQAGFRYDWTNSEKNTYPLNQRDVSPDFENLNWEEAMKELLAPYALDYTIEHGDVVLNRSGSGMMGKDTLVTLTSPYARWQHRDDDPADKISLARAVAAVSSQAGYKYDWKRSADNIGQLYARWTYPEIENKAWEEAMAELLSPLGVAYEVDGMNVILVMADGRKPPSTPTPVRTARRPMPEPDANTMVTLKSPYTLSQYKNGEPQERISVVGAVRELGNQAGYKLNWAKSKENVGSLLTQWIYPDFENITWEEAMTELLPPLGVAYEIDGINVILVMADGREPPSTPSSPGATRRSMPEPDITRLVTLKPPYADRDGPRGKISLQYSVNLICRQAGIEYDWQQSAANTEPLCRQYVEPDFEDVPWAEAMEEILDPLGLAHTIENGKVVLTRR